jgi:hypothetical protein
MVQPILVYTEAGRAKTFAAALDWPGWCRSAKDEAGALEALAAYAERYAPVAKAAGFRLPPKPKFDVIERVEGSATTDFGAPGTVPEADRRPLHVGEARRLATVVEASWAELERIAASAPAELRKGPRGGGRDRDPIIQHVISAETSYARKIGVRHREPERTDTEAVAALRRAVLDALAAGGAAATGDPAPDAKTWPARYVARRIAWHALDHAWEIQDKSS